MTSFSAHPTNPINPTKSRFRQLNAEDQFVAVAEQRFAVQECDATMTPEGQMPGTKEVKKSKVKSQKVKSQKLKVKKS